MHPLSAALLTTITCVFCMSPSTNCTGSCQIERDYEVGLEATHSIGRRQRKARLFINQQQIDGCWYNPALIEWPFEPWAGSSATGATSFASSRPFLVTYCQTKFCYFQVYQRFKDGWRVVKAQDILEIVQPKKNYQRSRYARAQSLGNTKGGVHQFFPPLWGDMRLFTDGNGKLRTIYYTRDGFGKRAPLIPWTETFTYNRTMDSLHAGAAATKLDISRSVYKGYKDARPMGEKNWSPFQHNQTIYFIYNVSPHRIVATTTREFDAANETGQAVEFVYSSSTPTNTKWDWGEMRGGTPAERIDFPDGARYLTFIHSQARVHHKTVKTYFMSAYLFDVDPPFAITHMLSEPLVPLNFYNASTDGWAYPNMDFVVFPVGIARADNDSLVLSVGVNDRRCYLLEISLSALLTLMRRV